MQERINAKRQARRHAYKQARAERRWKTAKLYNISTGKPAPEGASQSKQNITFSAYVKRCVESAKNLKSTYVNAKTGKAAPGITKETHQRGQHTTLYTWLVSQKHAEFSRILEDGDDLPPVPLKKRTKSQNAQADDKQNADSLLTLSAVVPPIDASVSRIADSAEQTPAQKKNQSRLARNEAQKRARMEGRGKANKLFNITTGKPAPEGATKSETIIAFRSYVGRHIEETKRTKTTYVNVKTGEPVPGITNETHKRGEHTTLFAWLSSKKNDEFSKILAAGGDLPPILPRKRRKLKNITVQGTVTRRADLPSALSIDIPPIAEASSVSAAPDSPLTTLWRAGVNRIEVGEPRPLHKGFTEADLALAPSFMDPVTPAPSATSSISALSLPPAGYPLPTSSLETFLSSYPVDALGGAAPHNSVEASDAATRYHSDPVISAAQDAVEQGPIRKRKPNLYSFFTSQANEGVGPASKKAKSMPSGASAGYPLPATAPPDSTSEVSLSLAPPAKMPTL